MVSVFSMGSDLPLVCGFDLSLPGSRVCSVLLSEFWLFCDSFDDTCSPFSCLIGFLGLVINDIFSPFSSSFSFVWSELVSKIDN